MWRSPSGRWQKRKPGRRKKPGRKRGRRHGPVSPASTAALVAVNRARRLQALGIESEEQWRELVLKGASSS
jgi:hypothetical protein